MGGILMLFGIVAVCFIILGMMRSRDRKRLGNFKNTDSKLYSKYKEAFDSRPGDFSGVKLAVGAVESRLLPGEIVYHSYALPTFYNKDANLFVLSDKRLVYVGYKLTKTEIKSIPYNKIENIDVTSKSLGTDMEVRSKEEKIEIYFDDKQYLDKFYEFLTEKQLSHSS